jgi:transcription elongation factor GreA-like protein/transcription elongation GreA/GreB family factor
MGYLKDFLTQINQRDFQKFLVLWEEYCSSDNVDVEEFSQVLKTLKDSDLAKPFGQIVETALPLWQTIENDRDSYEILRLLIDLQTTNSPALEEVTYNMLKKVHGNDPKFGERIRLVGLHKKNCFQCAISQYDLVSHMAKGNFVFHTAGWGTGEIMEVSFVREHLVLEFENIGGKKDISFANAFKTLIPLPTDSFLARRFANADKLEQEARDNPLAIIHILLRDIGPKTAAEIKDEVCDLVIPEKDWTKWWQGARAKMKKDPLIETPNSLKESFRLRKTGISNEELLQKAMKNKTDINDVIQTTYNFVRDNPSAIKQAEMKQTLQDKIEQLTTLPEIKPEQGLQIQIMLEQFFGMTGDERSVENQIKNIDNIAGVVNTIEIIAFKKRALLAIREYRKDWVPLFLNLIGQVQQIQLRDYLFKELNQGECRKLLIQLLDNLMHHPIENPEMFIWYFQKVFNDEEGDIPFHDKKGQGQFFEAFLTLYCRLENQSAYRELLKKMYGLLSSGRYALIRGVLQGMPIEFVKEFLLLASKCQSLSAHDTKIFQSLAEVVHPSILGVKEKKGQNQSDETVIWTTEKGFLETQERIKHLGTVEAVENAREIEAARALGDLRENSEYKFALEKRSRLQGELKMLSDLLHHARIITKDDISLNEVGIGNIVEVADSKGNKTCYTILGPWDANVDSNILSFQSKLAEAMIGCSMGDKFRFRNEDYQIQRITSFLKGS